jgi:hypothetical protein
MEKLYDAHVWMLVQMIAPLTVNLGLSSLLLNALSESGWLRWFIVIMFKDEKKN